MPVKRRRGKARTLQDFAPLSAWRIFFSAGADHLKDLRPYGIKSDAEAREAAPEAWRRLGEAFMATQGKRSEYSLPPWGLDQFGKPWERRRAG
jgi:hypothetical protein